jgi:iron complex outermembrane receptor protein
MNKLISILILAPFLVLNAQTGQLRGRIITNEKEALEGVNIIVIGTQYGASSQSNGYFEINNLPYKLYSLEISLIGYAKKKLTVDFSSTTKPLTIILTEEALQGKQIVISASKYEQKIEDLPVSTTVIQHDFITKNNYQTFDEMLRNIPGVQMNLEQPSIRGSSGYSKGSGARVLTAVNGIPMYSGDTGDIVWELIPITDIERIEIIKGPSSSLYGSSAIGGVINIITKSSVKNPITYVRSYFGAYDKPAHDIWKWNDNLRTFYGLSVAHSNSIGNLGYTLSFKKFDNMSYRQNDYAKRFLGYLKLNYNFSDRNDFTFFADYLNMDRGNFLYWKDSRNALVPKDEDNGNTVKSNRLFTGLIFNHHFSKDFTAQLKSSYYYTKFDGYGLELTESIANLFRNEVMINANLSNEWTITSGAELSFSKVSSNIFLNPNFLGLGAYFQGEYKGIDKLITSFGVRFDYMKLDSVSGANAVTPKVGLNYKLTNEIILRASFGTGFRAPTPAEVFTTTTLTGGLSIKGNTDLDAETSISGEVGIKYLITPKVNFDLALFVTNYKNYIEANLVSDGIQFLNVPEARVQGIEFSTDVELIPELLKMNAGYNYLWARNLTDKKALKYRPRHSFFGQLQFTPSPFELSVNFRFASRVEEIDDLVAKPPLALVVDGDLRVPVYDTDISAGYNFLLGAIPAKIFLNAKNIFNYNYVEFIGNIAPIRNYSLSWEIYF